MTNSMSNLVQSSPLSVACLARKDEFVETLRGAVGSKNG